MGNKMYSFYIYTEESYLYDESYGNMDILEASATYLSACDKAGKEVALCRDEEMEDVRNGAPAGIRVYSSIDPVIYEVEFRLGSDVWWHRSPEKISFLCLPDALAEIKHRYPGVSGIRVEEHTPTGRGLEGATTQVTVVYEEDVRGAL